jgi:hypothetical protein
MLKCSFVLVAFLLPVLAQAQSEAELKRYAELDQKCEAARAKKLAPIRAKKVATCVKDANQTRADCEAQFAHYGDTHGRVGGAVGGMFYDLPECVAATAARNQYRQ